MLLFDLGGFFDDIFIQCQLDHHLVPKNAKVAIKNIQDVKIINQIITNYKIRQIVAIIESIRLSNQSTSFPPLSLDSRLNMRSHPLIHFYHSPILYDENVLSTD